MSSPCAVGCDCEKSLQVVLSESYTVLHAEDIPLIAPSIGELQSLFRFCELELSWLDMRINVIKSCCIRIASRHDVKWASVISMDGHKMRWVDEMRYLGTVYMSSLINISNAL